MPRRDAAKESAQADTLGELEQLYRTAPIGLCLLDRDFRFVRLNEFLARIMNRPLPECIGQSLRDCLPEFAENVERICSEVLKTGRPVLERESRGSLPAEPERELVWLTSFHPLIGAAGRPAGVSVIVLDITDRSMAEECLKQRLEFETLLADLSGRFVDIPAADVDGQITEALKRIGEHIGVDSATLFQFSDDRVTLLSTHSWAAEGFARMPVLNIDKAFPGAGRAVRAVQLVGFSRPEELPEAAPAREYCRKTGLTAKCDPR